MELKKALVEEQKVFIREEGENCIVYDSSNDILYKFSGVDEDDFIRFKNGLLHPDNTGSGHKMLNSLLKKYKAKETMNYIKDLKKSIEMNTYTKKERKDIDDEISRFRKQQKEEEKEVTKRRHRGDNFDDVEDKYEI